MGQLELQDLLSEVADGVEPAGPDIVDRALGQARRRRALRLAAVPALAAVVAAVVLVPPQVRTDTLQPAAPSGADPAIPRNLPEYSMLTAYAKDAPGGRALAILNYYVMDTPRAVAVGADAGTYRRLGPGSDVLHFDGAALTPDGTRAALALPDGAISIQNLRTGALTRIRQADGSERPSQLGFSPDGRTLLVVRTGKEAALLDARTGAETPLLTPAPDAFAFSPDGQRIAVQLKGVIRIVDRTGKTLTEIDIASTGARLGGQNAWSPDGRFLVTVHTPGGGNVPCTFRFVPTDKSTDGPPEQIVTDGAMVAWRNDAELLVQEGTGSASVLTARGVRTGSRTVLADLRGAYVSSVATGLIDTAKSHPPGDPDFGPWPTWLVAAIVAACTLLVLLIGAVLLVVRRVRRTRPLA